MFSHGSTSPAAPEARLPPGEGEPRNLDRTMMNLAFPTGHPQASSVDETPSLRDNQSEEPASAQFASANAEKSNIHSIVPVTATTSQTPAAQIQNKPTIVGIYGISGCGKSYLINQLKVILGQEKYTFYEGSDIINKLVPGGLDAFKKMNEESRRDCRILAINAIAEECAESGKMGITVGHYMFWKMTGEEGIADVAWTDGDSKAFTHILYLNVPSETVHYQAQNDKSRVRPNIPIKQLDKWQQQERTGLEKVCLNHEIEFKLLAHDSQLLEKVLSFLLKLQERPALNLFLAEKALDAIMMNYNARPGTMLVLDADRTLCAVDTGEMFWAELGKADPMKSLFSGPLKYTLQAFLQASLLYDNNVDNAQFESTCKAVAAKVELYPEFRKLLERVSEQSYVGAVVVSCGLRRVWEMVLDNAGLSKSVKVIGGGQANNGYVVTANVKAAMVRRLQNKYDMHVWAFGDSPLDLPMLKQADEAIVVVGEIGSRSKTMDMELGNAITKDGLVARQALLPSHASVRLSTQQLPLFDIREPGEMDSIFLRRKPLTVCHASPNAAKLLQTPMRNAENAGVVLQAMHQKVGWFLATELVTQVIGVEEYEIPHVQGRFTTGYRLLHEGKTTIVALMRGGEPMAKGVYQAFPMAMFVHASSPSDLQTHHIKRNGTVLLVDSVINNGTTIVEFVKRIKTIAAGIRIVVVTGVAQKKSVAEKGPLARVGREGLTVVALRLSDNKYTGKGGTDTGNRLFNTTHID